MGTLFLVATPIGNLKDITLRALETLRAVDQIAAEDTRQTKVLLEHYDIHTPLTSYHDHNKDLRTGPLVEYLHGHDLAIVSDAGTPGLNDPGYELVCAALAEGIPVVPIPGASSLVTALTASGQPTDRFLYLGYLSRRRSERVRQLNEVKDLPFTLVCLETPHRLSDALADMLETLGSRRIVLCREMTKKFEEYLRLPLESASEYFQDHPPRGEFTLVIEGQTSSSTEIWEREQVAQEIAKRTRKPYQPRQLAKELASRSGWSSREIYALINKRKTEEGE